LGIVWRTIEDVVNEIREEYNKGKTKFLFYNQAETIQYPNLHRCQAIVELCDFLEGDAFILTCSAPYGQIEYDRLMGVHGWTKRMNILYVNNFESYIKGNIRHIHDKIGSYTVNIKPKKFVCFNKIQRLHRVMLLSKMYENNLVDKGFYSFQGSSDDWLSFYTSRHDMRQNPDIEKMIQTLIAHKDEFPLVLNITKDRNNPIDLTIEDIKYHADSYFSIVTETYFYHDYKKYHGMCWAYYEDTLFISEKTYKAIAFKHPFIVLGFNGTLSYLRKIGYKTFHPYIDESYDEVHDDELRFKMVTDEIIRLCNQSDEEWIIWQNNIKEIVEHNYRVLVERQIFHDDIDSEKLFGKK
jgi:hypothetical protein